MSLLCKISLAQSCQGCSRLKKVPRISKRIIDDGFQKNVFLAIPWDPSLQMPNFTNISTLLNFTGLIPGTISDHKKSCSMNVRVSWKVSKYRVNLVQPIMYYTKQVSQTKKIQKQKFIMAFPKQHSSSDMRTIRKHSTTWNTKLIQNYQMNIGI